MLTENPKRYYAADFLWPLKLFSYNLRIDMIRIIHSTIVLGFLIMSIASCGSHEDYLSDWEIIEKNYNNGSASDKDTLNRDSANNKFAYSIGIYNAIKNVKQICDISYTLTKELKCEKTYSTGTVLKGLVYSSSRYEDLFVPNNVSFWTFLSAVSDSNSYFYTRDISLAPYNIKGMAHSYYGQVCSSVIQYALGIKYNFQMIQMHQWDGMELLSPQIVDSIKPGVILMSKEHVMMCIDVERNKDGSIKHATIAEGYSPLARYSKYDYSKLNSFISDKGYQLYRYKYIDKTSLITSPFTDIEGNITNSFSFNKNIMPRRGDKSNWRNNENVEIDIMSLDNYNAYKVFKNDSLLFTTHIEPSMSLIDLGILQYGRYKMCLTNGTKDSEFVYWIVTDYKVEAEKWTNNTAIVKFASKNAKAIFLTWRIPQTIKANNNNMPEWTVPITNEDIRAECIITNIPKEVLDAHPLSKWDISVHFETEYGILKSDNITIEFGEIPFSNH